MLNLEKVKETISVVDDQIGQPTWTKDLVSQIIAMVDAKVPAGTYHGTSSGQTSWFGLTQRIYKLIEADPNRVRVVHPGVDLDVFVPGNQIAARKDLGLAEDAIVLLFVGRIQPLKAPDVLIKAAAEILKRNPELRSRLVVAICGGPSGSGLERPDSLVTLADQLGVSDVVKFVPPTSRAELVKWFQSASVCVVPSYSESFGLVAIEAQACGTPVIAARVGGLPTAVRDGISGVLVDGHEAGAWADQILTVVTNDALRIKLSTGAIAHASHFGWEDTTDKLISVYNEAVKSSIVRAKA